MFTDKQGGEMTKRKDGCPSCGGGIMEAAFAYDEQANRSPIWKCRNCLHEIARRTWKTKKRIEREARALMTFNELCGGEGA